jgi:MFS family permease
MLLVSVAMTAVASVALAFAQTFTVFVVAWAVQGFYVAWLPLQVALIYDRSRRLPDAASQTRRATGLIVAALQAGAITGALAGGFIGTALADLLWVVLLLPALLVVAVFFVVLTKVPDSVTRLPGSIDPGGVALLTVAMLVITGGLSFVRINGVEQTWPWLVVVGGFLVFVPFVRYELSRPDPLVDFRVLRSPAMWPVLLTAGLFGVSVLGAQGPLSTFARTDPDVYGYGLGLTAALVSIVIGAYVVSMLAGALSFARVSRRTTPRIALIGATTLTGVGYLLLVPFHDSLGQVLAAMTVAGLGSGALVAALPAAAAAAAPVGRTAVATGLTNTTKVMGGTVASCVFALVLAAGAPTLSSGVVGTAGSLSGYIAVWTICGVTALVAAAALLVVPKLAFADRADAVPDAERTPV